MTFRCNKLVWPWRVQTPPLVPATDTLTYLTKAGVHCIFSPCNFYFRSPCRRCYINTGRSHCPDRCQHWHTDCNEVTSTTDGQTRPCKISKINIRCQSWQIRDRVPRFWRGCVYPRRSHNMLISRRNEIDKSAFDSWESSEKCALCRPWSLVSKSSQTNEGNRFQLRVVYEVNMRTTKIKTLDLGMIFV